MTATKQKSGTVLVYRIDPVYGGSDYVEFYQEGGIYTKGNTRSHQGHGRYDVEFEVKTKKELAQVEATLVRAYNFQYVNSLYGYGGNGGADYSKEIAAAADRDFTVVGLFRSPTGPDTFTEISVANQEYYVAQSNQSRPKSSSVVIITVATKKSLTDAVARLHYKDLNATFTPGQRIFHSNLGEGIFVGYEMFENECIIEIVDTDGYKDELRVSTSLIRSA